MLVEAKQAAAYAHEKRMGRQNRNPATLPQLVPIHLHVVGSSAEGGDSRAAHVSWDGVGSWSLREARYHLFVVDKQLLEVRRRTEMTKLRIATLGFSGE